jgi:hypothetical protein
MVAVIQAATQISTRLWRHDRKLLLYLHLNV